MKNQQQAEYYKRAAEARRLAREAADPAEKEISSRSSGAGCPLPAMPLTKRIW